MAVITVSRSGNYSDTNPATTPWSLNGNVKPIAGDSIVVPAGLVLTMDEPNTPLIAGISGTGGYMAIPTTAGSYKFNCSSNIQSLTVVGGTQDNPVPANVNFEFQLSTGSGRFVTANTINSIYGYKLPTQKWWAKIKNQANSGATSIVVDGDVSEWQNIISGLSGKRDCKVWITKYSRQSGNTSAALCEHTITSAVYDAQNDQTTLTISALAELKEIDSKVTFETRNILAQSANSGTFVINASNNPNGMEIRCASSGACIGSAASCVINDCSFAGSGFNLSGVSGSEFNNCTFTATDVGIAYSSSVKITDSIFATGNITVESMQLSFTNCLFTGRLLSGVIGLYLEDCEISGTQWALFNDTGITLLNCIIKDNALGIYKCSGIVKDTTFDRNSKDINSCPDITLYNCSLNSTLQAYFAFTGSNCNITTMKWYMAAYDVGQVVGYNKCWTPGGFTITDPAQSTNLHPIFGKTVRIIPGNANYLCFVEDRYYLQANKTYTWTWVVRKDINMMTKTPYIEVVDPLLDTIYGFTALATVTAADNTDWQILTVSYKPDRDMPVIVRVCAQNGSGDSIYSKVFLQKDTERYSI